AARGPAKRTFLAKSACLLLMLLPAALLQSCGFIFPGGGPSGRYFDLTVAYHYAGGTSAGSSSPVVLWVAPLYGEREVNLERSVYTAAYLSHGTVQLHLAEGSYLLLGYLDTDGDHAALPYALPEAGEPYALHPIFSLSHGFYATLDLHGEETASLYFDDTHTWVTTFAFHPYLWWFEDRFSFTVTGGTFDGTVSDSDFFFSIDGSSVTPEELSIDHEREFWAARFDANGYDTGPHTFRVEAGGSQNQVTFHGWYDSSLGLLDFNLIWPAEGAPVYGGFEVFGRRFDPGVERVHVDVGGQVSGDAGLRDDSWSFSVPGGEVSGTQTLAVDAFAGGLSAGSYALSIQVFD
ncbi:MAG: hypothetical protein ACOC8N_02625, partial [Spirochaetota bacterium]